jgi:hypothetical protein
VKVGKGSVKQHHVLVVQSWRLFRSLLCLATFVVAHVHHTHIYSKMVAVAFVASDGWRTFSEAAPCRGGAILEAVEAFALFRYFCSFTHMAMCIYIYIYMNIYIYILFFPEEVDLQSDSQKKLINN